MGHKKNERHVFGKTNPIRAEEGRRGTKRRSICAQHGPSTHPLDFEITIEQTGRSSSFGKMRARAWRSSSGR